MMHAARIQKAGKGRLGDLLNRGVGHGSLRPEDGLELDACPLRELVGGLTHRGRQDEMAGSLRLDARDENRFRSKRLLELRRVTRKPGWLAGLLHPAIPILFVAHVR